MDATATDNCAVASIAYTLSGASSGSGTNLNNVVFNPGLTTVTWTATDAAGNSAICSFQVMVTDDDNPVITCPVSGQQDVTTTVGCTYVYTGTGWNATATDNCAVTDLSYSLSGATTGTGTSLQNVAFNSGLTTVTWRARDAANNTVTCNFTVQVTDDDNPVLTCPVSGTQNVKQTMVAATHSGTDGCTATDNCSVTANLFCPVRTGKGIVRGGVSSVQGRHML